MGEDSEPILSIKSSKRGKTRTSSVSVRGRQGDSRPRQNIRVQSISDEDLQDVSDHSDDESFALLEAGKSQQSRKRSHFSPVNTGSALKDNHELLKSWSVEEVEEVLHAKKQEEDLKVRKKYEAKAKSDVDVANAKKEKSELEINYGYDFELYSSTSAKGTSERWFIHCESAKSKPEKIFIPKEKVPKDQLLYVKWNNLTKKERVQHGNPFRNYLNVEIPGFISRRKIR
ncbi:hypothetical protein AA0111_g9847 [Alternaria arborescens]|uniref:hypothetical protein n=1 Tax=Alternaria arborescens TaxID=156630 RepID=UPI001074CC02|nr:hypothetical protein AA0111_g9847 [Alternaria arborescens]RYO21124.1 hypothetical protein AA0111_g9847 [Alternaria arborescens]